MSAAPSPEALESRSGQCDPQEGSTELRVGTLPWVHQSAGTQPLCSIVKEAVDPEWWARSLAVGCMAHALDLL